MKDKNKDKPLSEVTALVLKAEEAVEVFDGSSFEEFEGQGLENVTAADKAIPRLYLLQKTSPQCDEDSDGYVPGAKKGMLWNSLTGELHDAQGEGVRILPVYMHKEYVERDPDTNKFVATHPLNTPLLAGCTVNDKRIHILPNGNKLMETANHFVVVLAAAGASWGIISMASSAMKVSKQLIGLADGLRLPRKNGKGKFKPPSFSHVYLLKAVPKSSETFNWMGWELTAEGAVQDADAFAFAAEFSKALMIGAVKAAPEVEQTEGVHDAEFVDNGTAGTDKEVPF